MNIFDSVSNKKKKTVLQWVDPIDGKTETMALDVCLSATHSSGAAPTNHPVEDGSEITDHVEQKPKDFSFEAFISNDPFTLTDAAVGAATGAFGNIPGPAGKIATGAAAGISGALLNSDSKNRARDHYNLLRDLQYNSVLVTIITKIRVYGNMLLSSLSVPETDEDGLSFSGGWKEIRIVQSETVKIPEKNTQSTGSTQKKKLGTKTSKTRSASDKEKTWAKSLFDIF